MRPSTVESKRYWQNVWYKAAINMPRKRVGHYGWTLLATLLDYQIRDQQGRNCASEHMGTNARRGSAPRYDRQKQQLQALAGDNGRIVAFAMMVAKGIDIKPYSK